MFSNYFFKVFGDIQNNFFVFFARFILVPVHLVTTFALDQIIRVSLPNVFKTFDGMKRHQSPIIPNWAGQRVQTQNEILRNEFEILRVEFFSFVRL